VRSGVCSNPLPGRPGRFSFPVVGQFGALDFIDVAAVAVGNKPERARHWAGGRLERPSPTQKSASTTKFGCCELLSNPNVPLMQTLTKLGLTPDGATEIKRFSKSAMVLTREIRATHAGRDPRIGRFKNLTRVMTRANTPFLRQRRSLLEFLALTQVTPLRAVAVVQCLKTQCRFPFMNAVLV
jgi:hypothetical protein